MILTASRCRPVELQHKIFFEVAFDARVEQRKHHSEHAGIGVDATHDDVFHAALVQFRDVFRGETVAGFHEDQVVLRRRNPQLGVLRSRITGILLQDFSKKGSRRVDEFREDPAAEADRVALDFSTSLGGTGNAFCTSTIMIVRGCFAGGFFCGRPSRIIDCGALDRFGDFWPSAKTTSPRNERLRFL